MAKKTTIPTPDDGDSGNRKREAAIRRSRVAYAGAAEIGEIPPVKDPARKEACRLDLILFLQTYFPHSTGLSPFGDDHRRMILSIQQCELEGGKFANAIYRGGAKTTITENSALHAELYGHRKFVGVFGADKSLASQMIDSIQMELFTNDLLYEDFPEVCHAVRHLNNKPQGAASQTYRGEHTFIYWTADTVVFPTIPGSPASGAILCSRGLTSASRGVKFKRHDGTQQRPDMVIIDDPQTDKSAASRQETTNRLKIIKKGISRSGGHRGSLAIVVNGTVIEPDDVMSQLLNPASNPSWQGERIAMVKHWSVYHDDLWLGKYASIRNRWDRSDPKDQKRAHQEATVFYLDHRAEMDAGCVVSWESCFDHDSEVSAIQHAYNILIDDGPEVFASECQNQPIRPDSIKEILTPTMVAGKTNGLACGVVPKASQHVTAYVDVHGRLLYWAISAWGPDFAGGPIDYGTYPRQSRSYFAQDNAPICMADVHRGMLDDAYIIASLAALLNDPQSGLLSRRFKREDGTPMRVEKLLIDCRWGQKTELVKGFCRRHPHYWSVVLPAMGQGFGAKFKAITDYRQEPGAIEGGGSGCPAHWRIGPAKAGDRWVTIDTNWWKSFAAERLASPVGTPGGWELFGRDPREHELFADHCCSEEPVEVEARGRKVNEWTLKAGHNDNHWWDCLVGSAVAASMLGVLVPGTQAPVRRPPPRKQSPQPSPFGDFGGGAFLATQR